MKLRTFEDLVVTDLRDDFNDPEFALGYLQICLDEAQAHDDMGIFVLGLVNVARAQEAVAGMTEPLSRSRSSFYESLLNSGNFELATISRTLPALGLKFQLAPTDARTARKPVAKRRTTKRDPVAA